MTGIAGVNSNYELAVKFLGHAATSGEQDPNVTHGHRNDATGEGGLCTNTTSTGENRQLFHYLIFSVENL